VPEPLQDDDARRTCVAIELLSSRALSKGSVGLYSYSGGGRIHDEAARAEDRIGRRSCRCTSCLKRVSPSPMATLNHALRPPMYTAQREGSKLLRTLDSDARFSEHHRLEAVRHTCSKCLAIVKRHQALPDCGGTTSIPERNYLMTQAARLERAREAQKRRRPFPHHDTEIICTSFGAVPMNAQVSSDSL